MLDEKIKSNIVDNIVNMVEETKNDGSTRYKSWEHCHHFFKCFPGERQKNDINLACLNLAFFLASWGMYRGSSFLLQKDYLVHKSAVEKILEQKDYFQNTVLPKIKSGEAQKDTAGKIFELVCEIKDSYEGNKVSDTLASKIMLGTLGCIPAYDQFFISGLREYRKKDKKKYKGLLTLNKDSLKFLFVFYKNNKKQFTEAEEKIKEKTGFDYPAMKLVDMFFWDIGFQKARKEKEAEEKRKASKLNKKYEDKI